jgi:uncharacterized protein YcnI
MMKPIKALSILAYIGWLSLGVLAIPATVSAHASLDQESGTSGSSYRGAMLITHGCDTSPTISVRIRIPDGVKRVKPMAKAGWQIEVVMEKLDQPYEQHGNTITEEIREIAWSGGSLPDDNFDEFVFRGTLPETDQDMMLYFPVVQQCANGEFLRWIEIPEAGEAAEEYEADRPAPVLNIKPEQHQH